MWLLDSWIVRSAILSESGSPADTGMLTKFPVTRVAHNVRDHSTYINGVGTTAACVVYDIIVMCQIPVDLRISLTVVVDLLMSRPLY